MREETDTMKWTLEIDRRLVCLEEIPGSRDERPWLAPGLTSLDVLQGD